jgi:hypothetical protein
VPLKPFILNKFLFHEKHRNFPRRIVPTMRFSAGKICTISAGKAGIFDATETFADQRVIGTPLYNFRDFLPPLWARKTRLPPSRGWHGSMPRREAPDSVLAASHAGTKEKIHA